MPPLAQLVPLAPPAWRQAAADCECSLASFKLPAAAAAGGGVGVGGQHTGQSAMKHWTPRDVRRVPSLHHPPARPPFCFHREEAGHLTAHHAEHGGPATNHTTPQGAGTGAWVYGRTGARDPCTRGVVWCGVVWCGETAGHQHQHQHGRTATGSRVRCQHARERTGLVALRTARALGRKLS